MATHDDPVTPELSALVEEIMEFSKGLHRMKVALMGEVPDRAAYALLWPLLGGDKRASDLAELSHSDPSTVSRHISHLINKGMVHRVPDQHDGRAALVSITNDGRSLCESLRACRSRSIANALQHWPRQKTEDLAHLLRDLNTDLTAQHQTIVEGIRSGFASATAGADAKTSKTPRNEGDPA